MWQPRCREREGEAVFTSIGPLTLCSSSGRLTDLTADGVLARCLRRP